MSQIRIRQYTFQIEDRFTAGDRLTEAQAQALNRLRAENIRHNMSKAVLEVIWGLPDGKMLSSEVLAQLQAKITSYAQSYEFVTTHKPWTPGPIDSEARVIARDIVEREFRAEGRLPRGTEFDFAILAAMQRTEVQAEALARIEAQRAVALESTADL